MKITRGDNFKYLLLESESESEPESINLRLCQAAAEISKAATDTSAVLRTCLAGGQLRECERESRQTEVAPTETEFSGQQVYCIPGSEGPVNTKTNIATADCQQWKTWSAKHKFIPAALGKN